MRLVLVANPDHPRVASLQLALQARGLAPAEVVPYESWLRHPELLAGRMHERCWLKFEAPGEHAGTQQALIERGAVASGLAVPPVLAHGELAHLPLVYAGLSAAFAEFSVLLSTRPWVRCVNAPADILSFCDKWRCQERLEQAGVALPPRLGLVDDFAGLHEMLRASGVRRVFIKSRYGSSASGVVALEYDGKQRFLATTSVEMDEATGRLYNSLRIRRYTGADVGRLIDRLAPNGLYTERWIPKPCRGSWCFDWRVVALGGQPAHRLARLSRSPLTNLHLGNRRGEAADYLGNAEAQQLEKSAVSVAACFPDSAVMGIDMIVSGERAHVLEVNAFGDWLPRLLWQGKTVHEAEVDFLHQAFSPEREVIGA